ncbi:MAG: alpha/beta hydrolase [Pseudomonadota bacterium]
MGNLTLPDGTSVYFEETGTGLPILALAGLTRNSRDFDHVAPHLSAHRLIRMDYRGRGRSDWANPESYTVAQEGQDALALLDHLDIGAAAILGTSRGGLIGMGLAALAPERVRGVCLNDIGPELGEAGLDKIRGYVGLPPFQRTYEEAAAARARIWTDFEGVPMARWRAEIENQFEETGKGLTLRYDPKLRDALIGPSAAPPDLWPFFEAAAKLPLALIRGANSDLLTEATANEMARRAPEMIRAEVPGRGHVPFLDEPQSLAAIRAWLERLI